MKKPQHSARPKVLVVDDDEAQRTTIADILADDGFDPVKAADPREAIDLAPGCAAAVIDWNLRSTNALKLADRLHDLGHHPRLIIYTGFGSEALQSLVAQYGAEYLEKGGDPNELIETVRRCAESAEDEGEDVNRKPWSYIPWVVAVAAVSVAFALGVKGEKIDQHTTAIAKQEDKNEKQDERITTVETTIKTELPLIRSKLNDIKESIEKLSRRKSSGQN